MLVGLPISFPMPGFLRSTPCNHLYECGGWSSYCAARATGSESAHIKCRCRVRRTLTLHRIALMSAQYRLMTGKTNQWPANLPSRSRNSICLMAAFFASMVWRLQLHAVARKIVGNRGVECFRRNQISIATGCITFFELGKAASIKGACKLRVETQCGIIIFNC
jgi:hypothetical protein